MPISINEVANIQYEKPNGDKTARTIIATSVPTANPIVSALDVSSLSDAEVSDILAARKEYKEYTTLHMQRMLNFDDWLDHTNVTLPDLKYRSFSVSGITEAS